VRITAALHRYGIDLQATTIHRLLEVGRNGQDGKGWGFLRNADNPLPQQFLVVDEASMLDTDLAAALFNATAINTHVLLVGDPYQLPPVGHGAPLRDLIAAGVPCAELTEIQRNAGLIVKACAEIKRGRPFETSERFDPEAGLNLRHMEADTAEQSVEMLRTVLERFKASGRFDPVWGVQILTPMNERSGVSRVELNKLLQGWLNPPRETDRPAGQPFRVADKVICLRNCWVAGVRRYPGRDDPVAAASVKDYEPDSDPATLQPLQVFVANGDQGKVLAAEPSQMIVELLDPTRLVKIPLKATKEGRQETAASADARGDGNKDGGAGDFGLAYAITGHKSQGSEWPCVIVMIDEAAGFVCSREWLYTAISRARTLCLLVGKRSVVERQCKRVSLVRRKTFLKELLQA
jgi:exodeoxyribonuclease V alpha subunit